MTQPPVSQSVPADEPGADATQVVAIDGPSGAGKSSVARALADALGFRYLDTGAMYRAVTWLFLLEQVPVLGGEEGARSVANLDRLLGGMKLELLAAGKVMLNGEDVSGHIRSREVESRVSAVSAMPTVRGCMRRLQRVQSLGGPLVAEGRDIASVVFPKAGWKVFLDAEPEERARRRLADFRERGRDVTLEEVLDEILVRDRLDSNRRDAPLIRAKGAYYCDTSGFTKEQVVEHLSSFVRGELPKDAYSGMQTGAPRQSAVTQPSQSSRPAQSEGGHR